MIKVPRTPQLQPKPNVPTILKIGVLVTTVVLGVTIQMSIALSQNHNSYMYCPQTVTLMIELCRLTFALGGLTMRGDSLPFNFAKLSGFAIPAACYVIDNVSYYFILLYMTPPVRSVLSSSSILVTAILFRTVLGRRISKAQWVCLFLLLLGVVGAKMSTSLSSESMFGRNYKVGYLLLTMNVVLGCLAGIYNEALLKRYEIDSIWFQQTILYGWGVAFNGVALFLPYNSEPIRRNGFFAGYTPLIIFIIVLNSLFGVCVGFVLKFLDNMVYVMAQSIILIVVTMVSSLILEFNPPYIFYACVFDVAASVFFYHRFRPVYEWQPPEETDEVSDGI